MQTDLAMILCRITEFPTEFWRGCHQHAFGRIDMDDASPYWVGVLPGMCKFEGKHSMKMTFVEGEMTESKAKAIVLSWLLRAHAAGFQGVLRRDLEGSPTGCFLWRYGKEDASPYWLGVLPGKCKFEDKHWMNQAFGGSEGQGSRSKGDARASVLAWLRAAHAAGFGDDPL
mmetsp:Transcript_166424/g.528693  ORF Transcript_166424/g.528693 Transcript_166424/m.528693 type:complete len:171 (+) Transcript_166424:220-732(+)